MNKPDLVSPEVREVEHQLDNAFRTNYLVTLGFPQAAWYLLSCVEYMALVPILRGDSMSPHDFNAHADQLLTHLEYPLRWLYNVCPTSGAIKLHNEQSTGQAAVDLLKLANSYKSVVAAFTYATRGLLDLKLDGTTIVATHTFFTDTRYEAYNRLLKPSEIREPLDFPAVADIVIKNLKVVNDRFYYNVTPKIAEHVREILRPAYEDAFTLPRNWQFTRYSMEQFFEFALTIGALMVIHWCAHYLAAVNGCEDFGYMDSVKLYGSSELISRVTRYSGLDSKTITEIVGDLSYGNRGIKNPDPALQPLILLKKNIYALAPWIWITNSIERNLTVLINRLPAEQKIYAKLVNEKENKMRIQLMHDLSEKSYRFIYGEIPQDKSLPDLDLAIISDVEKTCLILELKWFIDPADIGEVIAKAEDLQKGVQQMNRVRTCIIQHYQPLFNKLGIDPSYTIGLAVVSANWIGHEDVQNPDVPIINQMHLTKKLQSENLLLPVIEWLNERNYLPTEGHEYEIREQIAQIVGWNLKWYGIKPLIETKFLPL